MSERAIVGVLLAVGLLLAAELVQWGSLMDIFHDYASPKVLLEQTSVTPDSLPKWTQCEGEWNRAMAIVYSRALALVLVGLLLLGRLLGRVVRRLRAA